MSRTRAKNCNHAYYRASERCGWDKKTADRMMKLARMYGIAPENLKGGEGADLLRFRQYKTNRRIKYFQGYVFIFASTSTRCYTVYPFDLGGKK